MDRAVDEWSATSIARTAMRAMRWQTSVLQAPMWNWSNSAPEVSGASQAVVAMGTYEPLPMERWFRGEVEVRPPPCSQGERRCMAGSGRFVRYRPVSSTDLKRLPSIARLLPS